MCQETAWDFDSTKTVNDDDTIPNPNDTSETVIEQEIWPNDRQKKTQNKKYTFNHTVKLMQAMLV